MKILLVEDDHLQAEEIRHALSEVIPDTTFERVDSEYGFRCLVDDINAPPPDVVIMDVMLRWTHPSAEMPEQPEDVAAEKHYRAGFRCLKYLGEKRPAWRINVILFTVLEHFDIQNDLETLPANVTYLRKEGNYDPFIRKVRRFAADRGGLK